jgi:hypothetical protein
MTTRQACGENLRRYGNRMDAIWAFRSAYNEARKVKQKQDAFCAKAEAGLWEDIAGQYFPDSLQWEMLVDVLRGRVKVKCPLSPQCFGIHWPHVDFQPLLRRG